jgi:rhodanese-related sulfurtransferase
MHRHPPALLPLLLLLLSPLTLPLAQPSEVERGAIEGAVNFPLSSLRQKLTELPQDKKLYVYCQVRACV